MSISKDTKKELIAKFANTETDTGSPQVQIAVISEKINNLIEHFKTHKHDLHSKKGLVALVNKRKKLLNYLERKNKKIYKEIIKELKIRG